MDMNRYLIVVFCVLTGCAAVVPGANAQDFTVDQQLFAEWYADHIQHFDDSFASPILAQVEQENIAGTCFSNPEKLSVLKNLPKIPALNQKKFLLNYPLPEEFRGINPYSEVYYKQIPEGDIQIRAPGIFC